MFTWFNPPRAVLMPISVVTALYLLLNTNFAQAFQIGSICRIHLSKDIMCNIKTRLGVKVFDLGGDYEDDDDMVDIRPKETRNE